jgi:hypothetical protein
MEAYKRKLNFERVLKIKQTANVFSNVAAAHFQAFTDRVAKSKNEDDEAYLKSVNQSLVEKIEKLN